MTLSVWVVTRELGNGRHRAVIGIYREEAEARDRIRVEEAKDAEARWDFDLEEFDVIGDAPAVYVVLQDTGNTDMMPFVSVEDEGGALAETGVINLERHPQDRSLVRLGPFERAA